MGTVITNQGNGSIGEHRTWSITESATPAVVGGSGVDFGTGSIVALANEDTELVADDPITLTNSALGTANLTVSRVGSYDSTSANLSVDSALGRLISGTVRIPAVESGSPLAALDMVLQMSGLRRCTSTEPGLVYWSLAGHSAGFDYQGARALPVKTDSTFRKPNLSVQQGVEVVQYQEVSRYAAISAFSATSPLYPSSVLGPTPKLGNGRTYVKFKTIGSLPYSVSFTTGPDRLPYGSSMATSGYACTMSYNRSTRVMTVTVTYRDASGTPQTATASSNFSSTLGSTGEHTVVMDTYVDSSNRLFLRAGAIDASGVAATPVSVLTATVPASHAPRWASRMTITGLNGFKDLAISQGSNASGDSQWAAFYTHNYVDASTAPINELANIRRGAPIAAGNLELWTYLQQVGAARDVEIAATPAGIVIREPRIRTIDIANQISHTRDISMQAVGRYVDVTNYATKAIGAPSIIYRDEQSFSVNVNETRTYDLRQSNGLNYLWSPLPSFPLDLKNASGNPYFVYPNNVTLPDLDLGYYYVVASDNIPVTPLQWLFYGGLVTTAITAEGVPQITLRGPQRAIPNAPGPFTLALSDSATTHPQVRLAGEGVQSDAHVVRIPTGADPRKTNVDTTPSVNNVAIGDLETVFTAGSWAASRAAGPTVSLTLSIDFIRLGSFGVGAGSLVTFRGLIYRVNTVDITSGGTVTLNCTKQTSLADADAAWAAKAAAAGASYTLNDHANQFSGLSLAEHATRPLSV